MTFTDTKLLAALVALAIPVAIHLMGRRRARRMILPTVRFAEAANQASRAARWLRRAALLALRLAAVALLVLALAGPRIGGERAPPAASAAGSNRLTVADAATSNSRSPVADATAQAEPAAEAAGRTAPAPIRVLIVDAEEAGEGVNSADLVAATFSGDTNVPKKVTLAKAKAVTASVIAAADVVFWVGGLPDLFAWLGDRPQLFSPQSKFLEDYLSSGGRLVWIPGSEPLSLIRNSYKPPLTIGEKDGVTIDPDGYTSDLLAAFEGGTSGDLSSPVFRRRIYRFPLVYGPVQQTTSPDGVSTVIPSRGADLHTVVRFHGGSTAIAEWLFGRGRVVALAFGPDPYWGDLAGRPEFVVLMHSLAEALAPVRAPTGRSGVSSHGARIPAREYTRDLPVAAQTAEVGAQAEEVAAQTGDAASTDLTLWFVLALGVVLVAESLLAAVSVPRGAPAAPPITKAPPV